MSTHSQRNVGATLQHAGSFALFVLYMALLDGVAVKATDLIHRVTIAMGIS
jgi:hypothetical protein